MTKFYVVDSVMGNGKTSAMQHLLLNADLSADRYIVVVPLLTEVGRWKKAFQNCNFHTVTPEQGKKNKTKTADLKELLRHRAKMIIITHSMFERFDDEITELLRAGEYTLVIDEVPVPVRRIDLLKDDIATLIRANTILIDPETMRVSWNSEYLSSQSVFSEVQDLCKSRTVFYNPRTKAIYQISPYSIYFACKAVYILTYMFEAQLIYYYLKQRNVEYKKFNVFFDEEVGSYYFADDDSKIFNMTQDWRQLINICDNKRMNAIGDKRNALSVNWFEGNPSGVKTLKKNVFNFSRNICKAKAENVLWTTYMDYRDKVEANGFKKGFLAVNAKATNDFSDRTVVSYIANRFVAPDIKNYFNISDDLKFDEDAFALSEMLQFIWRSAIRNGQPINLYVPSSRMRGLLEKWIEENSVTKTA